MNARYMRGRRAEWKSRDRLVAAGYIVVRAAGSKGAFDLVAWTAEAGLLVQVKCDRWPSPREVAALVDVPTPPGFTKVIHRWDRRLAEPRERPVSSGP